MRHEILDIASETGAVDVDKLADALDDGRARRTVMNHFHIARTHHVTCSPQVFLFDGTNHANPGIRARWANGPFGTGFPIIDVDDPTSYADLITRAADLATQAA